MDGPILKVENAMLLNWSWPALTAGGRRDADMATPTKEPAFPPKNKIQCQSIYQLHHSSASRSL